MKKAFSLCAAALYVSSAAGVEARDVAVSYQDLNLASLSDQTKLDRRVKAAARDVCDYVRAPGSMVPTTDSTKCYHQAVASGRTQINLAVKAHGVTEIAFKGR